MVQTNIEPSTKVNEEKANAAETVPTACVSPLTSRCDLSWWLPIPENSKQIRREKNSRQTMLRTARGRLSAKETINKTNVALREKNSRQTMLRTARGRLSAKATINMTNIALREKNSRQTMLRTGRSQLSAKETSDCNTSAVYTSHTAEREKNSRQTMLRTARRREKNSRQTMLRTGRSQLSAKETSDCNTSAVYTSHTAEREKNSRQPVLRTARGRLSAKEAINKTNVALREKNSRQPMLRTGRSQLSAKETSDCNTSAVYTSHTAEREKNSRQTMLRTARRREKNSRQPMLRTARGRLSAKEAINKTNVALSDCNTSAVYTSHTAEREKNSRQPTLRTARGRLSAKEAINKTNVALVRLWVVNLYKLLGPTTLLSAVPCWNRRSGACERKESGLSYTVISADLPDKPRHAITCSTLLTPPHHHPTTVICFHYLLTHAGSKYTASASRQRCSMSPRNQLIILTPSCEGSFSKTVASFSKSRFAVDPPLLRSVTPQTNSTGNMCMDLPKAGYFMYLKYANCAKLRSTEMSLLTYEQIPSMCSSQSTYLTPHEFHIDSHSPNLHVYGINY
ncbi:hypothetical protein J6590_009396 [Homalodisca vitripennis]|nr:hypothetical protein J6590_009396 [Homalodisca vitripennis]